ncbi:MAG: 5-oxoprolinase subunit PxpB [Vicinamibacteria bacterium]|jgi:KipI family sensor histidine kinase inhibitor|nr:5-oxoprolinase subunit PxpB [Vicinamibacteria bacterium]
MSGWQPLGDAGFLFDFASVLDAAANARAHALAAAVRAAAIPGIADVVPAYASVAVALAPDADPELVHTRLAQVAAPAGGREARAARTVVLPCCFDGPDLAEWAAHAGLAAEAAVARFASATYAVALLGFQPGFPYLLGLDPSLAMPRRAAPRPAVSAGSVAIGGAQAGIYPRTSPGGWRLLGRVEAALFDPRRDPPSLLLPGDRVRFRPTPAAALPGASVEVHP